ncbi:uncharacterized protein LOC143284624 [Babylonia areolata]|uniref:uncharacterized protein LOC143284624 n=1 Tax=Babylonia areolata TaxID=304850 RepID=UPI003FD51E87
MTTLPQPPRTSEMTFWSRHDPVRMPRGNTDNWAKLRVRANTMCGMNSLEGIAFIPDAESPTIKGDKAARFQLTPEGGVRRLPDPSFSQLVRGQLRGQLPGDLGPPQPSANIRKTWLNNEFQKRARQNFRYWLVEKPAPTQFGRYGIGSFKTVLGVGNAPRT